MLNWSLLAERRILAAMERGEFDNLPGRGEPLRWKENPLVPLDWRLAFDVLERAGLAPEWIMRYAEIRAELAALEQKRERERLWMEERRQTLAAMPPEEAAAERERLQQVQHRTREQLRRQVEKLNRKIADWNLIVPVVWLQRAPLDPDAVERALQAAWGELEEAP
ncbi:MAG: DUF1992 domain-containing protein [Chloroflexia bacterium]